ncbi:MAG: O-antigen ligase family protein [Pyrinomonadaceae bacterium]
MTTLISNASAEHLPTLEATTTGAQTTARPRTQEALANVEQSLASRFIILTLCVAIVLSTLAYGTVHNWSLAVFQMGAALIVVLWAIDAWTTKTLRFNGNILQLALLGLIAIGLVQLLPLGGGQASAPGLGGGAPLAGTLSLDPYATRFVLIKTIALFIYFAAALAFIDSPRRLRLMVYTITVFGFLLAIFGLIQYFSSPTKIYWITERAQSLPFGPFINRHHFAGYMELTLALPLGLVFSNAIDRDKSLIFAFVALLMGIGLIMTNSRGGIISLLAEIFFLVIVSSLRRKRQSESETEERRAGRVRGAVVRVGLGLMLVFTLFIGVVLYGGEDALSRFVGTVNASDPTTGRAHFWSMTVNIIRDYPLLGTGLGSFGMAYTRYDTRNGTYRLEHAHNDYLQLLSDAGIVGAVLGVVFVVALFRLGFARRESRDKFRRGVAIGALAGCFAVLVHSFFDFTLHTPSNALLFLLLAAFATINGRVEQIDSSTGGKRRRRRRRSVSEGFSAKAEEQTTEAAPATALTSG